MSVTAAFILVVLAVVIVYDVWAYRWTGVPTITFEVRRFIHRHAVAAFALALAIGFLLGHLFWTPPIP